MRKILLIIILILVLFVSILGIYKLNQDKEIKICAREKTDNPLYVFDHYHKGDITDIGFHFLEDASTGVYFIEADNTFIEYIRNDIGVEE